MTDIGDHRLDVLAKLADVIAARRDALPDESYTARLLQEGTFKAAKKLGEEGVEAALAAATGDRAGLREEACDMLYHLLVVLEASEVPLAEVMTELEGRFGIGGLADKARRKQA